MITTFRETSELARFLVKQRVTGYNVPTDPHFDAESTVWFKERLPAAHSYLEFGSGGSTLLAHRLGKPTISIENDRFFAAAVRKMLPAGSSVTMHVIDIGLTGPWGVPVQKRPNTRRLARWRAYVEAPFRTPGSAKGFPDLVLVDGRFRRACALEVIRQAQARDATTTIMVDDYYSDGRDHYAVVEAMLDAPERVGRAAIFESSNAVAVSADMVSEALQDFR